MSESSAQQAYTRRDAIRAIGGTAAVFAASSWLSSAAEAPRKVFGITAASYGLRWRVGTADGRLRRFETAVDFLDHAERLGTAGIQAPVGMWDKALAERMRKRVDMSGLYFEGQVELPADAREVDRFETQIRLAKLGGATIVRTVCLNGRRYEAFDTYEAFQKFVAASRKSLELAEPIVARHDVRLAVENHKDWRVSELLEILERLSSRHVGVCLDTGNSIALLEDPMDVVRQYARWTFTTHFKDMAVRECDDGFLLSEVSLGKGMLDLPKIVEICRGANPHVRFNLEMITRDPLRIACLDEKKYWATFPATGGKELARTLRLVRTKRSPHELPSVAGLKPDERLALEEKHVIASIEFARGRLGL